MRWWEDKISSEEFHRLPIPTGSGGRAQAPRGVARRGGSLRGVAKLICGAAELLRCAAPAICIRRQPRVDPLLLQGLNLSLLLQGHRRCHLFLLRARSTISFQRRMPSRRASPLSAVGTLHHSMPQRMHNCQREAKMLLDSV
jgi:hypothetical protein